MFHLPVVAAVVDVVVVVVVAVVVLVVIALGEVVVAAKFISIDWKYLKSWLGSTPLLLNVEVLTCSIYLLFKIDILDLA